MTSPAAPSQPFGTLSLLLLFILVVMLQQVLGMELVEIKPDALAPLLLPLNELAPLQWITAAFIHDGWLHLAVNLPFLWLFATRVEARLGKLRFQAVVLALLIAGGLLVNLPGALFGLEGTDQGADALLFGLMAVALLWEPEEVLARPQLGGRPVPIPLAALAGLRLLLEPALPVLAGGHGWAAVALHPLALAPGAGIALLLMRLRWVDCAGWDLVTRLRAGKLGQGRPPVESGGAAAGAQRGDAEEVAKANVAVITDLVAHKAWDAAYASWLSNQGDRLPVPLPVRERLIRGLLAGEKLKEAKPLLRQFLEDAPANHGMRLLWAQVLVRDQRPGKALDMLAMLQGKPLQPAQAEKARALEKMARQLQADGVLEMDE